MSLDYVYVAIYTYQGFVCIVGFIGLKRYRQISLPLRVLEWYILGSITIDCISDVMVYKNIHTLWLNQCFTVIELLLYSYIFYLWRTSKRNGILVWYGLLSFLLFWIVGKFIFEPITGWDNYSEPIAQLIQIGFGGWILLRIIKETNIVLKKDIRFWVLSGIVLYAVATFFFFGLFTPMLISNRKLLRAIWPLNDVFIVMQYFFFLRAFLCKTVNSGIINQSEK
jgi:hypothetical protein